MSRLSTSPPSSSDKSWQAEEDLRTLKRAMEIQKDSARYAAACAVARREMKAVARFAALSGRRNPFADMKP